MVHQPKGIRAGVLLLLGAAFLLAGCGSDGERGSITGPTQPSSPGGPTFLPAPPTHVAAAQDLGRVTRVIGFYGGELRIGEVFVRIPRGALFPSTTITMSMLDEAEVRFRIEPEGAMLMLPATIGVDRLSRTDEARYDRCSIARIGRDGSVSALPSTRDGDRVEARSGWLGSFALVGISETSGGSMVPDPSGIQRIRWLSGPGYATARIPAATGGQIVLDRFRLVVPPGALLENTFITIRNPGNGYLMCELLPHGLQFQVPVVLEMDVNGLETGPDTDWTIFWFDTTHASWVDQNAGFQGGILKADLPHFSEYAAGRGGW